MVKGKDSAIFQTLWEIHITRTYGKLSTMLLLKNNLCVDYKDQT